MRFAAIVVAAGSGTRAGGDLPKQFQLLGGKTVLRWSVEAMREAGGDVCVVASAGDQDRVAHCLSGLSGWQCIVGGATRVASVRAGIAALPDQADLPVLIHDAARPFIDRTVIDAVLAALDRHDGALPVLPVADTIKQTSSEGGLATLDRASLWRAQTPQAARLSTLKAAFAAWTDPRDPTDDAQILSAAGIDVAMVEGSERLFKLTWPEDLERARSMLNPGPARRTEIRTGQGIDAHRWGPGDTVWLCGVAIDHDQTLIGHSDADAGLHALTDAVLGAIGAGDIGDHFPPTDPQWKGAASAVFLAHAAHLARERGGRIVNVDVTLICERPRIKPHRQAMRAALADILDIPVDRVSVKATTTEGLGYTGRQEGLLAQAIASVELPLTD